MKPDGITPLLSDDKMRALGFTDIVPERWYICIPLEKDGYTTLNITIQKDSGFYEEYVLNEAFGQPEYYGNMAPKFRDLIRDTIDFHLDQFKLAGLLIQVDHRAYGCI